MFIICDDLGWQDIGCYDVDGNAVFETPYIDALAKEGVQFWQGYSPSPVCAPSRASVLTGKHPARLGMTSVGGGRIPHPLAPHMRVIAPYTNIRLESEEVTLPEILGPKGYYNGHVGKWHLVGRDGKPNPFDQGFDWSRQNRGIHEFFGMAGWLERMKSPVRVPYGTNAPDDPYKLDENGFAHDQNTQDALDFMKEAVEKKKPFYCYYAPYIVHAPNLTRTESLLKKYCAKMGYDYPLTGKEEFSPGQTNPYYAAMVETFDYNVHQIVSFLKTTDDPRWPGHKLFENTYVFITSDNGGMEWDQENATDNYPLDLGKIHQHEGGTRVPFIILGPNIAPGVESDVMINGYDVVPTMLSLAGEPIPDGLDGLDLSELLHQDPTDPTLVKQRDGSVRDAMLWHFPHSHTLNSTLRKGRWKLFHNYDHRENPELNQYSLYELYQSDGSPKDIHEATDVSEQHAELTAELAEEHQAMLEDLGGMPAYRNPNGSKKLPHQDRVPTVLKHGNAGDGVVWVEFETDRSAVVEATLYVTRNGGSPREDWFPAPAQVVGKGRVEASVPEGTTHYVFNLVDENDFLISYPEVGFRKDVAVQSVFALPYRPQPSEGAGVQITVGGPSSGYAETNMTGYRSRMVKKNYDADGDNVYGSEGLFFFGVDDSDKSHGFANHTQVGAEWATFSPGADATVVVEGTQWNYSSLDDPGMPPSAVVPDWDIKSAFIRKPDSGTIGGWEEALKFVVDENSPQQFRIGLMAGTVDSAVFHPTGLRISVDGGAPVEVKELDTSARIAGMVFFDVDLKGKTSAVFSIEAQRSSKAQGAGLTGVTFDLPIEQGSAEAAESVAVEVPRLNTLNYIDWPEFIARQDMVWTQIPKRWNEAPFMGNGMIGLFLYQEINNPDNSYSTGAKNELALHLGRGDYYDNRAPLDGKDHTWIYRGRLPIGFFRLQSKGDITAVSWRMDLWNARLIGEVKTSAGSYQIEGKVHALYDSIYWKVTPSEHEAVDFVWQPQKATSFARDVSLAAVERGKLSGGEVSHFYTTFASTPYPDAPEVELAESDFGNTSRQVLHGDRGELVMAWTAKEDPEDRSTTLLASIAFSQDMGVAMPEAKQDLKRALAEEEADTYSKSHEQWWHDYYPRSYVSVSDDFWEQFYWIQMYKLASASRADGMMLDTAGPWYQPGFHPLVWSDLNVQLCYWAQLTSNRTEVGKSLLNVMDRNIENLSNNVHPEWRDECLDANTVFPGDDLIAPIPHKKVADHVVWMLHNYWLFCRYENDSERMRDGLFPLLKRANATYLRYIEDHPVDIDDGKLHFKHTWSPEAATGVDMNYTIALARWSSRVLLQINEEHQLNDPKASEWQNLLDHLVGWQTDENGLRLGRDFPFDHAHRHYSHLLGYYPLFELTPDTDRELIRRSVDHWLAVTENPGKVKDSAMPVTGYTCTGAASMYAGLEDGEKALEYLRKFTFVNIYSNTLYAEGKEQLIETPISAASAMHDMLLQSWGGRIRIMPGVPNAWQDIHFQSLLCEGGALVSADRSQGELTYAQIESPDVPRRIEFKMPMDKPEFSIMAKSGKVEAVDLKPGQDGFYEVDLPAGAALVAKNSATDVAAIKPVKSPSNIQHIFGNSGKYEVVREQFKASSFREPIGITK